jgi:membrane protease YdiL (CAAX protease family)
MKPLKNTLILLVPAGIIGLLYAYSLSIPARLAAPLLAAMLIEAALYLAAVSQRRWKWIERPLCMAASGIVPYLVCVVPIGAFDWTRFAALAGLAALLSFWYAVLPRHPALDLAFVAAVAAGFLLQPFDWIYPRPHPKLPMAILGELMWTRLGILAVLVVAKIQVKGFGLWPSRAEWIIGARNFVLFLPAGGLIGWISGFASFRPHPADWRFPFVAAATFFGMLLVVALREEFFFRGVLQEWTARRLKSDMAALGVVAVVFGLVHLPFRDFPNWTFALLAAVAGLFYGRAYLEARSVRAAMVTHALVNTVWRTLF